MNPILFAAQDHEEIAILLLIVGVFTAVMAVVSLIVGALICLVVSTSLARIPAAHRKMEPGLVWLLLIPCFAIVWNFVVFQRVPDSFKSHFDSQGRTDVGDCGRGIGLAYSISAVCCLVPLLNYLAGPVSLVLLILSLVRFHDLKTQIAVVPTALPAPR